MPRISNLSGVQGTKLILVAQEAVLSGYTSKGILTINEARAVLGREPLADTSANKPMTLTNTGFIPLPV